MVIIQARSRRKPSGGLYRSTLSKRRYMIGRNASLAKIGENRTKAVSTKGGNKKTRMYDVNIANVFDGKKYVKATIAAVVDNAANRNFVRRNIITKGAIIDTDKGKAKVTSRPGQDGVVNAVLVQ